MSDLVRHWQSASGRKPKATETARMAILRCWPRIPLQYLVMEFHMHEGNEITSSVGAVAAGPPEAARVGTRILEKGGNAFDAASAASMACCMLQVQSTGVAGYVCCAVVIDGKTGQVYSVDANSIAPAAAHEEMYEVLPPAEGGNSLNENEYACRVRDDANVYGPLAVGPPGMMAGMGILWERWGRLKWPEIVEPSLKLLEDGFPFESTAGAVKSLEAVIRKYPASVEHLMPEGRVPEPDDIWHRRDMEKTLERVADAGWRDFYEGEIGREIADAVQSHGGILTAEDMAEFEPRITEPYEIAFRNSKVYGPILTNGCISSLEILRMLDCFEPIASSEVAYWHRFAEVSKLAWRDRLRHLGDPDFVAVPVDRLLSHDYAMGRTETIRQYPEHVDRLPTQTPVGSSQGTLHVSTADTEGNLVSITISQGGSLGSCFTVPGLGLVLGHGMCRLDPRPGRANSVGPKKRPLNNTACVVVRSPDRDIAAGLPGGRRIICVTPCVVQQLVEEGRTGYEAATAPRLYVTESEPLEITDNTSEDIVAGLRALGHEVELRKGIAGAVHCAEILKGKKQVRAGGGTWAAGAGDAVS